MPKEVKVWWGEEFGPGRVDGKTTQCIVEPSSRQVMEVTVQ